MSAYQCELCGVDRGSYSAMMRCEDDCYDETVAARKNHVSPRVMRPAAQWDDE